MNLLYYFIIKPIETVLGFLFGSYIKLTGNYGFSIILLSLSVTIIMFPLFYLAEVWKRKEQMVENRMNRWLSYVKKYYTGQKRYCMIKTIHRLNNYTAASSFRTSFGLLIQIPFFFAAYHLLSHYEPFRGVGWLFIKDFAVPDGLLWGLNLLPLLMTVINIVSSSIYMRGSRVKDMVELYVMAGVFLLLLYASPAALVLYWTMNNVFSVGKSLIFLRLFPHEKYVRDPEDKSLRDYAANIIKFLTDIEGNKYNIILNPLILIVYFITIFIFKNSKYLFFLFPIILLFVFSFGIQKITKKEKMISLVLISFFFLVVIPFKIFLSNKGEFQISGKELLAYLLPIFLISTVCVITISFLFKKTDILERLLLSFLLLWIVNGLLIPLNAGVMSGFTFQKQYKILTPTSFMLIKDIIIIISVTVITKYIFIKKRNWLIPGLIIINIIFCCMDVSLYYKSKNVKYDIFRISSSLPTEAYKIHTFSKEKKNVVFFMIDMMNGNYVERCLEEQPNLYEIFSGFTWYKDLLSIAGSTVSSLPALLGGGDMYSPLEMNKTNNTYQEDARKAVDSFFIPFVKSGWKTANVYEWGGLNLSKEHLWELGINDKNYYEEICFDYIGYWLKKNGKNYPLAEGKKYLLSVLPLYQLCPHILKKYIYDNGTWNNPSIPLREHQQHALAGLAHLDLLPYISSVSEEQGDTFLYVLNGLAHDSFGINKSGDFISLSEMGDRNLAYYSSKKALLCLSKFIVWLKEKGIYDNTMIIIVSDHGNFICDNDVCNFYGNDPVLMTELSRAHATLLVKNFNGKGHLNVNDIAQLQNSDVYELIQEKVFHNGNNFSKLLSENNDRVRTYSVCTDFTNDYASRKKMTYHSYKVVGSMFKKTSWEILK